MGRFGIRANVLLPGYIQTDMTKGDISSSQMFSFPPVPSELLPLTHYAALQDTRLLIYKARPGMDKHDELSALIPIGRLGLAEEVADAALFLAQNTYAHNCVLNIDGGLSAT